MKCKDCSSFKPQIEAGSEITPDVKEMNGKCAVNKNSCLASDECGCDRFSKKK